MKKNVLLVLGMLLMATSVNAQINVGSSSLANEIQALRDELQILQRQVYRDQNVDLVTPKSGAELAVQVGQFDEQLRSAMGRIDEMNYKIKTLEDKIDLINKDIDARIKMLEGKPINGGGMASTQPTTKFGAAVAVGAPASVTGGSIQGDDLSPVKVQSVQEIYDEGLEAVKKPDYVVAEQKFNELLKRYPNDKLAGNAQYWLGEVFYAQKDYQRSAVAFARVIENYKDGPKGADSLLKLGMSMQSLNKKEEACQAFKNMKTEFPKADKSTLDRAAAEAKKLGC